jgi:Fe-S-cluster containining protein
MHREENGQCSCKIYEDRPVRCRAFNCRQLQAVEADTKSEAEALEMIKRAKAGVARVDRLISQIAETNPNRSLAHRVANALTLSKGEERTPVQDELDSAMKGLEELLQKEFRV